MTEDDTFKKLKRLPIDQLIERIRVENPIPDWPGFLEKYGWIGDDFFTAQWEYSRRKIDLF